MSKGLDSKKSDKKKPAKTMKGGGPGKRIASPEGPAPPGAHRCAPTGLPLDIGCLWECRLRRKSRA
jgi:hypothetical protein